MVYLSTGSSLLILILDYMILLVLELLHFVF